MKTKLALAALSMLGGMVATSAFAQDGTAPKAESGSDEQRGFYAGAGINLYFIDKDDAASGLPIIFEDQPSPGAFVGRLGYAFNQYFAVEVEAGFGGAKSEFEGPGLELDIGVAAPLGAHLVVSTPVGDYNGYYLMGKAGYSSITVERKLNGVDAEDLDISGASFGVGGGVRSGAWDFRFEYNFMSGDDGNTGVLGMLAMHRF